MDQPQRPVSRLPPSVAPAHQPGVKADGHGAKKPGKADSGRVPVVPPKRLVISRSSAGFISRGHPWVRPDRFTRGLERLELGESVTLLDDGGKALASALVDPQAENCARVFHRTPDRRFDPATAVTKAWTRRGGFHKDPKTTCYRIAHGEADWLPGLRIERLGDVYVVLVLAACMRPHLDAACAALHTLVSALGPEGRVIVREHLDDIRVEPTRAYRWLPGGQRGELDPEETVIAKELGVTVHLKPCAGLATGIYVDQRETRHWLRKEAKHKRVLNLFAYTGVFSSSLLMGHAAEAVDVDISAPALELARRNAEANGVAARHSAMQAEAREFLAGDERSWDVVICDPPTSAQGDGGWILRRDYPDLLAQAWRRTAPGGLLLACCNTLHGKPFTLHETVMGLPGAVEVPSPGLGDDLPQLPGFPEGRPFRLVAVRKG